MKETVKATGRTIDEAVEKALTQLGITREEAEIRILEKPSTGLMGLLRKKQAVVEVSPKVAVAKETPASSETVPEVVPAEEAAPVKETEAAETASVEEPVLAEPESGCGLGRAIGEPALAKPAEEKNEEKPRWEELPFSQEEQNAVAEKAKEFLAQVFLSMGLEVTMEKMTNEDRILLDLHGEGLGILIGKHGQTLNALQYLTNLAAGKLYRRRYFVMLDVESYRSRREKTLTDLAHRLADKVKRTGQPVSLEPMDAAERRIIHLALQKDRLIETESEGNDPGRHVVIWLKK